MFSGFLELYLLGWPSCTESSTHTRTTVGDGIFSPGGSVNNMMAGMLARNAADPEIRVKGLKGSNKELVMFVSKHAHYSNKRTAMILGLGSENVISVPVMADGKMDPSELHKGSDKCDKNVTENKTNWLYIFT